MLQLHSEIPNLGTLCSFFTDFCRSFSFFLFSAPSCAACLPLRCVYFCSRFLAEIAREKEEVEEERYRRRSQDSGSKERARAGWFDAPMGVVSNFDMFR